METASKHVVYVFVVTAIDLCANNYFGKTVRVGTKLKRKKKLEVDFVWLKTFEAVLLSNDLMR